MANGERVVLGMGAGELFQLLRDGRPRTRSELAAVTGLSRSTISSRIDELVAADLVTPVADALSTGGRPPARIAMNPSAKLVVAADLGATHGAVALLDLAGTILVEHRARLEISLGPERVLEWVLSSVTRLLEGIARPAGDVVAVGVGLPGPVEHSTGKPSNPPIMPGWNGYDVPTHLQRRWPVPVLVDNDVNILALGEQAVGWPGARHMVVVKVSTGIGAGIIANGILQRGADGSAGDIGHIPIQRAAGVPCRCGNRGCVEAVAAGPAIAAGLAAAGVPATSVDDVLELIDAGDLRAVRAVRQAGRDLGEVLNMCVSIVNPSLIVIGGSMARAHEHLIAGVRETVYSRSIPLATEHLTIASSRAGEHAGVIGAGVLAIQHALAPEQVTATLLDRSRAM
jgi:predicted NBD/HSP70 family sugar kinase